MEIGNLEKMIYLNVARGQSRDKEGRNKDCFICHTPGLFTWQHSAKTEGRKGSGLNKITDFGISNINMHTGEECRYTDP